MKLKHSIALACACAAGIAVGHVHARFSTSSSVRPPHMSDAQHPSHPTVRVHQEREGNCTTLERKVPYDSRDPERELENARMALTRELMSDPRRAVRHLPDIHESIRDVVVAGAFQEFAHRTPDTAFAILSEPTFPHEHHAALLQALAATDPQRALAWIEMQREHANEQRSQELYGAVIPALLQSNPEAAAQAVVDMGAHARIDLIQQVALQRSANDAEGALTWTTNLAYASDFARNQVLQAVAASVAASRPAQAQALLDQASDQVMRRELMRGIANTKAQDSVSGAWSWLQQYRDDASYRENARALLSAWSYAKPTEVAAVIAALDDREFQRAAAEQLSNVWKERDATAWQTWVAQLPVTLRDALARDSGA